ncbi:GNAT family N-acetyltransferase [Marinomonas primoryensis]|uniref:GNAT family N-acetyltransferase n=1 Tax=Marinomonas primoryensis TaxID=178399 RepID=UPI0019551BF2|nr:GNAT family N-acetyltransferase [Marinomonas primoryensis]
MRYQIKSNQIKSNQTKRIELLSQSLVPEYSFVAVSEEKIIGLVGFQVPGGSLTGGITISWLIGELGFFKGLWTSFIFSFFDRKVKNRELIMDGIAVKKAFRGKVVGSQLLDQVVQYAAEQSFKSVRLDVVDSNPRAKKLYELKGFVSVYNERFDYLKWLVGFSGVTTMILKIECKVSALKSAFLPSFS